jgi:hypothetical protein
MNNNDQQKFRRRNRDGVTSVIWRVQPFSPLPI